MAKSYIGKISAIVTVNTADAQRAFNRSADDATRYGRSLQRTIEQATKNAGKSFDNIFTPFQRFQRAFESAKSANFNIGGSGLSAENLRRIEQLALAAKQLADPLAAASKQFDQLGFSVQRQFSPAIERAQTELLRIRDVIEAGGSVGSGEFEALAKQIDQVTASTKRLGEASALTKKLLTTQDAQGLSFVSPQAVDSINRLVEAQKGLSSLPASTRGSSQVRDVIQQAQEAATAIERIRARIERLSSQGLDIRVSQAGLDAAVRRLDDIRQRTEAISEQANVGLATDVSERLRSANAIRQAAEEEAAFRSRAADQAEREARALEQLTQSQNRLLRSEADRRSGAAARRNAAAFDAATESVMRAPQRDADVLIGRRERTVDSVRAEIRQLDQELQRLPQAAQDALQGDAERLNSIAEAARKGSAGLGTLIDQYERFAAAVSAAASEEGRRQAALREANRRLNILNNESSPLDGNRDPRRREIANLGGDVDALRRRVTDLAEPLRATVGPEVDRLTTRFQNLARAGVGFTADEARRLARETAGVRAALDSRGSIADTFARSFGGAGTSGLNLGIDERSLRSTGAQIEFVQGRLAALAADARGPVVAALETLRSRAEALFRGGAIDTEEGRAELQALRAELVRTLAAAEGGGSERRIAAALQRVGDVARGSFGNIGLAVQQAAFAFEDFFSVTGGLDQRIRAAGNNLSQLGFILGSTRGLIAGIAIGVGAQFAAMLIKWANNGRTAEDEVKALNDALARQKSLVEDLVRAFDSLGDSIARRAFSGPAQQARQFAQELEDVAKKQRELREARVADLDEGVQRERANQNRIRRQLENEQNIGRRVALAEELRQSQQRERDAARAAVDRPAPVGAEIAQSIRQAAESVLNADLRRRPEGGQVTPRDMIPIEDANRRAAQAAGAASPMEQRRLLQEQLAALTSSGFSSDPKVAEAAEQLGRLITALETPVNRALDELSNQLLKSSLAAAIAIESAQNDVADAIRRGVPAAADFQAALDNTARQMDEAQKQLRDAQQMENPDQREAAVKQAQDRLRDIESRRDAINERAREIRLGRTFGGQRTTEALSSLQGNERFANEYAGLTARLTAAVDAEVAARAELEQAVASGNQSAQEEARANLEAAQRASEIAAAYGEVAVALEQALSRLRKVLSESLSDSERLADDAQRRLTQNPTSENRAARDEAERQLIQDRRRIEQANNAIDFRRSQAMRDDPELARIGGEIEAIRQEREKLAEEARVNGTQADPARMRELADRQSQFEAEREERLRGLTQAEREAADAIAWEIDARRRLIEQIEKERAFDQEVRNRQNPVGDAMRGLDLLETPDQRAARDAAQSAADAIAAFDEQVRGLFDANGGLPNGDILKQAGELRKQLADGLGAVFSSAARGAAPAIADLFDSVQNAIVQGPSRAALNVADVSTQEGSRELTRLLRGDDPARNVNVIELEKQNQSLLRIIEVMKGVEEKMGIVVELK